MDKKERRILGENKAKGVLEEQAHWRGCLPHELDQRLIGQFINTRKPCSCECCGRKVNMDCYMDWKRRDLKQFEEMEYQAKEYFENI